jgi:hypothetical protein
MQGEQKEGETPPVIFIVLTVRSTEPARMGIRIGYSPFGS